MSNHIGGGGRLIVARRRKTTRTWAFKIGTYMEEFVDQFEEKVRQKVFNPPRKGLGP